MATSGQQEVLELFGKHLPSVAAQATTQEEKRLEDSRPRKWPKPRRQRRQAGLPRDQKQPRLEQQLEPLGRPGPGQADGPSVGGGRSQPPCASDAPKSPSRGRPSSHPRRQRLPLLPGDEDDRDLPPIPSFAGNFYAIAQQWQKIRDETPERVSLSLRDNPAPGLHDRVPREASPRRGAGQQGSFPEGRLAPGGRDEPAPAGRTPNGTRNGRRRSSTRAAPPITHAQVLDSVARLVKLLSNSSLVHKFRATRPLAETYDSNILTFLMTVATRGQEAGPAVCHDAPPHRLQRDPPDVHPRRQGAPAPPAIGAGAVTRGPDASSGNPASGQTLEHATAAGAGEDGGLRPHPVFLKNPHNVCYLNATVTGLLWAGDRSRPSIYGAFAPIYVPGLLPWASLLHNWARLAQQQDASEFLAFLLRKLCSNAFAGTWAARLNDGDVIERRDQGAIPPPLPLAVPDQTQSVSLQQLLNDWHAQEATFALSKAPQFLFLQLKRYKQVGL